MNLFDQLRNQLEKDPEVAKAASKQRAVLATARMVFEWRRSAGLSQKELGQAVGMKQEAISRIERGISENGPKLPTLAAIAKACGRQLVLSAEPSTRPSSDEDFSLAWSIRSENNEVDSESPRDGISNTGQAFDSSKTLRGGAFGDFIRSKKRYRQIQGAESIGQELIDTGVSNRIAARGFQYRILNENSALSELWRLVNVDVGTKHLGLMQNSGEENECLGSMLPIRLGYKLLVASFNSHDHLVVPAIDSESRLGFLPRDSKHKVLRREISGTTMLRKLGEQRGSQQSTISSLNARHGSLSKGKSTKNILKRKNDIRRKPQD